MARTPSTTKAPAKPPPLRASLRLNRDGLWELRIVYPAPAKTTHIYSHTERDACVTERTRRRGEWKQWWAEQHTKAQQPAA